MGGLKEICTLLGLPVSGGKESLLNGIVEMLNQPYDTKKRLKVGFISSVIWQADQEEKVLWQSFQESDQEKVIR